MTAALPSVNDHFDYESALAGCAARDVTALRRLYEHAAPYLLGVAVRIVRDRALAEDVLHDAFVKVWSHAHTFDPARGAARGWLFSLVRHQALNLVRDRLRLRCRRIIAEWLVVSPVTKKYFFQNYKFLFVDP